MMMKKYTTSSIDRLRDVEHCILPTNKRNGMSVDGYCKHEFMQHHIQVRAHTLLSVEDQEMIRLWEVANGYLG